MTDQSDNHLQYDGLDFTREELSAAMAAGYKELIAYVNGAGFRQTFEELYSLPEEDRPQFVKDVFMNAEERNRRGMPAPPGVLVQTSAFGDRRPTLFCVKKFLPERFHGAWENVNLTFDNEFEDETISRDPKIAWRKPLPVGLQNVLMSASLDAETVPDLGADDPTWPKGLGDSTNPANLAR